MRVKKTKATVVLIDEDKFALSFYEDAIRSGGFALRHCYTVESALEVVGREKPDLIVLDVMMPPGRTYSEDESRHGLWTGVLLHEDLQRLAPGVPIIVLTNCSSREILSALQDKPKTKVLSKAECPPVALVEVIDAMIGAARRS
jgi:CheY-like chemotaxis protein